VGLGKCTTSCNSNQVCNGGCCDATTGMCQPGNQVTACGGSGICSVCPTNAACATYSCNGTSCVASYLPSSTQCAAADPCLCTGASFCTGSSASCPAKHGCLGGTCCNGNGVCVSPCL
jgi:hypothetical protein